MNEFTSEMMRIQKYRFAEKFFLYIMAGAFIMLLLALSGCSAVRVDTVTADGRECHASRTAWFMTSDAINGEVCGGRLGSTGSRTDTDALAAVVSAAVSGAVNAVTP